MYNFKRLTISDFPLLFVWLTAPHVKEYWDTDTYYDEKDIYDKYYPRMLNERIKMYIIYSELRPIGYIQTYKEYDQDKYLINEESVGIDIYIGDSDFLHKGYGKDIISEFISKYVFSNKLVNYCVIDPELKNVIAQKAYYKVGFRHVKTIYSNKAKKEQYLMVLRRDQ